MKTGLLWFGIWSVGATLLAADTKVIMHGIFADVQEILPLSLDAKKFADPANRPLITKHLKHMADNSAVLRDHVAVERDESIKILADRMRGDAQRTYSWYKQGRFDEAQFYLHNMVENCISCHSKLPAGRNFPGAAGMFQKVAIKDLGLAEQAWLQVASRQFDDALNNYEKMLRESDLEFEHILNMSTFKEYLKLAIRVKGDFNRPRALLKEMAKRKNNNATSKKMLANLINSVDLSEKVAKERMNPLEKARILVAKGEKDAKFPADRENVVYQVTGSAFLNQFVDEKPKDKNKLAEAYYLLGKAEMAIGRSFWISETETYYELAIRTAPKSSWAKKALKEYKDYMKVEFSGSGGTFMPEDVKERIKTLEDLTKKK